MSTQLQAAKAEGSAAVSDREKARVRRRDLIKKLQEKRTSRLVLVYITSTRPGHEIQMADDVVRRLYDHLERGKKLAEGGVDLFIHSNGGSGTVPWRLVTLIREYTKHFALLVPHHAFSAATLTAMGADEIVMHRNGCLGPIDPSVANIFNPPHPFAPGQPAPISVEDVTAYFKLVTDEVGIKHEDELVQALLALTEKIHPLALGNVQRSHNQARMMARKLLKLHMPSEAEEHKIGQIIETLKSNLFYHGHPINRAEAEKDLALKIVPAVPELEQVMWELYLEYEQALHMTEPFNPIHEMEMRPLPAPQVPLTTQAIVQQMIQMHQNGISLPGVTEEQIVKLAAAMIPFVTGGQPPSNKVKIDAIPGGYIESEGLTHVFLSDLTIERTLMNTPAGPQEALKQEVRWQRWEEEK